MNTPRILLTSCAVLLAPLAHAQFTITEISGGPFAGNLSTLPGSSSFGKDEIAGGGIPIHKIPNVRDGIYGNSNSWIGDSLNSFIGISLGAVPLPIGRFAFGRDNTATFFDRTAGLYTIEYTTEPNPTASTVAWTAIGTINHAPGDSGVLSTSRRHAWNFAPVSATGLRLITPGSSFADGACIDELEVAAFAPAPFTLQAVGGAMGPGNVALSGTAFAKDVLPGYAAHTIPHLNDGLYGNDFSWIGNSLNSFAGVTFTAPIDIDRVAFGRDNTPFYSDRAAGYYLVQYSVIPGANETTPDAGWTDIGPLYLDPLDPNRALRHEYSFDAVAGATALRIVTPGDGIASGAAIDELEVYSVVPEPGTAALLALGGIVALRRRGK